MTQPLALVLYEKLLPGTQLVNRLQDLNYRVRAVNDAGAMLLCAAQEKPLLVMADLHSSRDDVCDAITVLKKNRATRHIPVLAFAPDEPAALHEAAKTAGVTLIANEAAILNHLQQFLDRVLHLD